MENRGRQSFGASLFSALAVSICIATVAQAQTAGSPGKVFFNNRIAGALDAPVTDVDGQTRLQGDNFFAQLYAGPTADELLPVGGRVPFRIGAAAGYIQSPGEVSIPSVAAGELAYLQMRVWEAAYGNTFEIAQVRGGNYGVSVVFTAVLGGNVPNGPPTTAPPPVGLEPFSLIDNPVPGVPDGSSLGTINFNNRVAGTVDAPITDIDGQTRLAGTDFVAQLYGGPAADRLFAAGEPVLFRSDPGAGYIRSPGDVTIPGVWPGELAYLQMRVWEVAYGDTFETAQLRGGKYGLSVVFTATLGGKVPDEPPRPSPFLTGLQPFGLVIETKTIAVSGGFSLISNPLVRGDNKIVDVLPSVPDGTILYRFDGVRQVFNVNIFDFGRWTNPEETLPPGEGAFILNPGDQPLNITFLGAPTFKEKLARRQPGFYLIGCPAPISLRVEEFLAFPPKDGDTLYRLVNGVYQMSLFEFNNWQGFPPIIPVGESAWLRLAAP